MYAPHAGREDVLLAALRARVSLLPPLARAPPPVLAARRRLVLDLDAHLVRVPSQVFERRAGGEDARGLQQTVAAEHVPAG
eukprot:11278-Pelagococcus_subviridis.AAC.1